MQAAPTWPRAHAVLALALQATGKLGPAAEAMAKAAWLARVSDGDAASAEQYRAMAEDLRLRKGARFFDMELGLFGEATAEQEDAAAQDAVAAGVLASRPQPRLPGVLASRPPQPRTEGGGGPVEPRYDAAATLDARLRALEAPAITRARSLGEGLSAAASFASLPSDSPASAPMVVPRRYVPPPDGAFSPRVLPPGGWQPPPQRGGPLRGHD